MVAKGLIAALTISMQLAGAPVVKAEPREHLPLGQPSHASTSRSDGVVRVETLRRPDFTPGTVEPSARSKPALQELGESGSDPGLPSTLELITLVLMLVVLAELCGGAIAERRRLRPASGAATTASRSRSGAGNGGEPDLSSPVLGRLGLRGAETARTRTHEEARSPLRQRAPRLRPDGRGSSSPRPGS